MRDASSVDKLKIALFGDLSLEEAMDLSRDRQILQLQPTFRSNVLPPCSESKSTPSKENEYFETWMNFYCTIRQNVTEDNTLHT
jgi:hypothetical protein